MKDYLVFSIAMKLYLSWTVVVADFDDSVNKYKAVVKSSFENKDIYVIIIQDEPIGIREGEKVNALITGKCSETVKINESESDRLNQWIREKFYLCEADSFKK